MTQENIQEVIKEEAEYQELQEHLGIIKALTDRARKDLIDCIKTIASRDKEALTIAAKSLAKNLVAVEEYSGKIAKELVTEKIISASLVNALDNLTKPQEVNNDSVPEEAPKAKSINIIHPDADENVIARGEIPSVQQVDDLAFKEEEISEIIYGNEEAKETSLDEKVTEAFDKVGTLVKEPDYNQWVHDIKEKLKNDTVRSIMGRKVYFMASNPVINEIPITEDPNHVDITQYVEAIDAESLKYILIERHVTGGRSRDTLLFEVDDQDVVEDHVFGRVNRHRYVGPDNRLTTLAKSLIKEVPNQHAFHHPYVVSSADC